MAGSYRCGLVESCGTAGAVAYESVLQFVMREMGNGVLRAESARVMRLAVPDVAALRDCACLGPDVAPAIADLAAGALLAVGLEAVGWMLAPPLHGMARFMSDGVTEITLRIVSLL